MSEQRVPKPESDKPNLHSGSHSSSPHEFVDMSSRDSNQRVTSMRTSDGTSTSSAGFDKETSSLSFGPTGDSDFFHRPAKHHLSPKDWHKYGADKSIGASKDANVDAIKTGLYINKEPSKETRDQAKQKVEDVREKNDYIGDRLSAQDKQAIGKMEDALLNGDMNGFSSAIASFKGDPKKMILAVNQAQMDLEKAGAKTKIEFAGDGTADGGLSSLLLYNKDSNFAVQMNISSPNGQNKVWAADTKSGFPSLQGGNPPESDPAKAFQQMANGAVQDIAGQLPLPLQPRVIFKNGDGVALPHQPQGLFKNGDGVARPGPIEPWRTQLELNQ